jgi:hypothetical protein
VIDILIEIFSKRKVGDRGRKGIYCLVEIFSKRKVGDRRREIRQQFVVERGKSDTSNKRWKREQEMF